MRPELRSLIHDYQAKVGDACHLLRQRLELAELDWFSWKPRHIPPKGWLDDAKAISYRFHGIGCCVEFGSVIVDFDFGPGGRRDGFDAWRLSQFARSTPNRSQFDDDESLHRELIQLLNAGELVRDGESLGSHLFYFPTTAP